MSIFSPSPFGKREAGKNPELSSAALVLAAIVASQVAACCPVCPKPRTADRCLPAETSPTTDTGKDETPRAATFNELAVQCDSMGRDEDEFTTLTYNEVAQLECVNTQGEVYEPDPDFMPTRAEMNDLRADEAKPFDHYWGDAVGECSAISKQMLKEAAKIDRDAEIPFIRPGIYTLPNGFKGWACEGSDGTWYNPHSSENNTIPFANTKTGVVIKANFPREWGLDR